MVLGGVLDRNPTLSVASVENQIGWIPFWVQALDKQYDKYLKTADHPLSMKPSELIRRQVFATFEEDAFGAATCEWLGSDNYLWASDFPHPAATWPHSHKVVERDFAKIPEPVTRKIVRDNAARLYGIATS